MTGVEMGTVLRTARILQILLVGAVVAFAVVLAALPSTGYAPSATDDLPLLVASLGVISVVDIAQGNFLPRWMVRRHDTKSELSSRGLLMSHILGLAFFGAIGVYGLLLGLMGAGWAVTVPFFAVSAAAPIATFPTKRRWEKMLQAVGDEPA
ncbi:MAG: hypothetical protein Q7T04_02195 [Dehalococcoidia bacterium]|nr:hypothetical protein [Dehalococcoidia bacterium]